MNIRIAISLLMAWALGTADAGAQCPQTFDFFGIPSSAPFYYSCNGQNFTLNLQSPQNWTAYEINWGDGSPIQSGASWTSPQIISHIYAATVETYTMTITQLSNGCTVTGTVVMEEATSASIQIPVGGLTQACAPEVMDFTNSSTNVSENTTFTWNFGDGSAPLVFDYTNLGQTVSHLYEPQTVDCETVVSLTAQNFCNTLQGGPSQATFNPIRIWDVDDASISASATVLCFPDNTVTFTNTTVRNCLFQGNIAQRYEWWNFGDYWGQGQDSIIDWTPWPPTFPITISYPGLGSYEVMMLDSNQCGIDTAMIVINIIPPPNAGLNVSSPSVCQGQPITFFQQSTGGATNYQWNFGDNIGWLPTGAGNITYVYNQPGTYFVQTAVSIPSSGGSCADTAGVFVTVFPGPQASFAASAFQGCDNLSVNFFDASQDASQWTWNFGNGNTFSGQHPPPQDYTQAGNYVVTLNVVSPNGCPASNTQTIQVFPSPTAAFSVTNACQGAEAFFTDLSVSSPGNPIISWLWNFGGGVTSTLQNPTHIFAGTGTFLVTLTVEGVQCTGTVTIPVTVGPAPVPNISATPVSGCSPLLVNFTNNTFGSTTYLWDFDDGQSSQQAAPSHLFFNTGNQNETFMVHFTAFNAAGCGRTDSLAVVVFPGAQAAFVDNSNPPGCAPFNAVFTNTGIGADSYAWDFGDGGTSTATNPNHLFQNNTGFLQTYTVQLIAFKNNGCHDTTSSNIIVYPMTNFNFTVEPDSGCSPLVVNFPFVPGVQGFNWDFGDGNTSTVGTPIHTYTNSGPVPVTYTVTLVGTSAFGCVQTVTSQIQVNPSPTAQFTADVVSGCSPLTVNLTNLSSAASLYTWNYGDNQTSNTNAALHSHVFSNVSAQTVSYYVQLTAATPDGCHHTFSLVVQVFPEVTAQFINPPYGCAPYETAFVNNSPNAPQFSWDLGNGLVSSQQNPTTTYAGSASADTTYTVVLTATSQFGCTDTHTGEVTVGPTPIADWTLGDLTGCAPFPLNITNNTQGATQFFWNYGDGNTSTTSATDHTYTYNNLAVNPQNVVLSMTAVGANGCQSQISLPFTIFPQLTAGFNGPAGGCSPLDANFFNLSFGAVSYQWDFGDGTGSQSTNPTHGYALNGTVSETYTVTLTATSTFGCTAIATNSIAINPNPTVDVEIEAATGCYPIEVTFENNSVDATSFQWIYGDGLLGNTSSPIHLYTYFNNSAGPITFTATLIGSNSFGCTAQDQVSVPVPGQVSANFQQPPNGCGPLSVNFLNNSVGAASVLWDFGDGQTSTQLNPVHVFENTTNNDTTYHVTLTIESSTGCTQTITQQLTVFATPDAQFAATPESQVFPATTVDIANNTTGGQLNYTWNMGDGTVLTSDNPQSHTYASWGTYVIVLNVTNGFCSDVATQVVTIVPPQPVGDFIVSATGCVPLTVTFENTSQFGETFFWQFGDGATATATSPIYTYTQPGTYTVTLTVTGVNGQGTDVHIVQDAVVVHPVATAAFVVTPGQVFIPNQQIETLNLSEDATSYLWNFGDGIFSTEFEPAHTYTEQGFYDLTLIAYNQFGCPDTMKLFDAVHALEDGFLEFPNAFRPSQTGGNGGSYLPTQLTNDIFFPVHRGVEEYTLWIYNRWGELLFESNDVNVGWDGWYRGLCGKQDVYVWRAKARFTNGKEVILSGDLTLLS